MKYQSDIPELGDRNQFPRPRVWPTAWRSGRGMAGWIGSVLKFQGCNFADTECGNCSHSGTHFIKCVHVFSAWLRLLCVKLSAFILLLTAGSSFAADMQMFPFYRELRPPAAGAADVAGIMIDRAIYNAACAFSPPVDDLMARLRIIDRENIETPFCFRIKTSAKAEFRENPFLAEVLSFKELPENRAEIIVKRDGKQPAAAGLWIHTAKQNFEKQVTISGSMDRDSWTLLAEAVPIFDYSRFIDVRSDRVSFATNDFIFFKIAVANITESRDSPLTEIIRKNQGNAGAETTTINAFRKEPFRMDRISFLERKEIFLPSETETREEVVPDVTVAPDPDHRRTVVTFDAVRRPLTALTLEINESNFSRPVSVSGADMSAGPWTDIVSERISRIDAGKVHQQHLTISLNGERRYRHYRVMIDNHDNPPLTITAIRAKENIYEILFFPKTGSKYRLYYGGCGREVPAYDTEAVLRAIPPGASIAWAMGAEQKNPAFTSAVRTHWFNSKIFLITAVVLMVGVLLWAIYRTSRLV